MSVKFKGFEEAERTLQQLYSSRKTNIIMNNAMNSGAEIVENNLKSEMKKYKDSGYTEEAVTRSKARNSPNGRNVRVGFDNEHGRASIIHLGEFGYTTKGLAVRTPAFGAVQRVAKQSETAYFSAIQRELAKMI
ncbi:MAG: hypothetical protein L0K82_03485 [Pisciglobus halotolerans]|nr:hypothetical protein [Pisciglobus halotolerans]